MAIDNDVDSDPYERFGEEYESLLPENRKAPPKGLYDDGHNRKERADHLRFVQEKAEATLSKHLKRFDKFDESEKPERLKEYFEWRDKSLAKGYPENFDDEDLEKTHGTGWAKAFHKPSLIEWTESGRPTLHENQINAEDHLYIMLEEHLEAWRHVSKDFKKTNNPPEV